VDVTMPQLGETVTEGTITRWLKQVGEHVDADEPLFEVSTDKVDSEVPAPSGGVVTEILVPEGETVDVGTRLAVVSDSAAAEPASAPAEAPAAPAEAPAPAPAPAEAPALAPEPEVAEAPAPAPAPVPAPEVAEVPPAEPPPAEPPPIEPPPPNPVPEPEPSPGPEPVEMRRVGDAAALTSPIVRRLVAERGLDPATITGTGPGGRLTRKDVLDASAPAPGPAPAPPAVPEARAAAPAPPAAPATPAPAPAAPVAPAPVAAAAPEVAAVARDEVIPFDNIRRRTAEHMVRSKATSAHVYTSVEVDFERIERARAAHQAEWKATEGFSLTYLPFIARAFCDKVNDFPRVNASVGDDALVVHHDVNLSIAVDLDFDGLVAPVIRAADGKRLRAIAREVHDLAGRARTKRLMPDDVLGGTFTITNPGPFGTHMTMAIINQPQVAILSTDGIKKRPVVLSGPDGDSIAIHHTGMLVFTWDHRAFDGAYAAAFLRAMQTELETRDWEAELD
jgi:pyruvate dehydrogenase E2 component (dihydrolipoamide acetyltransferase)